MWIVGWTWLYILLMATSIVIKAWWQLYENPTNYIEQVLEATLPQNNSRTATYFASLKPSKSNEQDM